MSKANHKPAPMAAVENAARMVANTSDTVLQAGCTPPVQAGCAAAPLQVGCAEAPLLAGCTADGVGFMAAKK